jgi:hypothetical protein
MGRVLLAMPLDIACLLIFASGLLPSQAYAETSLQHSQKAVQKHERDIQRLMATVGWNSKKSGGGSLARRSGVAFFAPLSSSKKLRFNHPVLPKATEITTKTTIVIKHPTQD